MAAQTQLDVTLQSITEKSGLIKASLVARPIDMGTAEAASKALYSFGMQLVCQEFMGKPIKDPVDAVVVDLNEALALEEIQHCYSLQRILLKSHRLFVELMWWQCWKNQERPTREETIHKIKQVATQVMSLLPQRPYLEDGQLETSVDLKFEVNCLSEAIKYLNPNKANWEKYIDYAKQVYTTLTTAAAVAAIAPPLLLGTFALPAGWKALKTIAKFFMASGEFGEDILSEMKATWYHDVWNFQWLAANIKTAEEFDKYLMPLIKDFCESGEKYALCVAVVLMEIIQNHPGEEGRALRDRAFSGSGKYFGLLELVNLEKTKAIDWFPGISPGNRRKETRQLAAFYVTQLVQNPNFSKDQHQRCIEVLKERLASIKEEIAHPAKREEEFLQGKLREIQHQKEEEKGKQAEIEKQMENFDEDGNPARGTNPTKTLEELEEAYEQSSQEQGRLSVLANNIEDQLEVDPKAGDRLVEEEKSLKAFLSSISV